MKKLILIFFVSLIWLNISTADEKKIIETGICVKKEKAF